MTYATIERRAQRISQLAFLRLLKRGDAYQLEAPTLWDVDFRTAVAQAELEDREQPGAYHKIRFRPGRRTRGFVEIDTTRPELIPACVAIVAHPDDPRYQPLFGTEVDHAALRRARAGEGPHACRSREGHRRRDDLHLRRRHRRHLVARAGAAGARGHPAQRRVHAGDVGRARVGVGRRGACAGAVRPARRPVGRRRRGRGSSRCCARAAICSAIRGRSRTR